MWAPVSGPPSGSPKPSARRGENDTRMSFATGVWFSFFEKSSHRPSFGSRTANASIVLNGGSNHRRGGVNETKSFVVER